MKVDVVYKLGSKCAWADYEELKHSLRSLTNFTDLGEVYIVGSKPKWIKNVKHIQVGDPYTSNKDGNLINKMILACCDSELSDKFINISDDMFFLKRTSLSDLLIPLIDNSNLSQFNSVRLTRWQSRLKKTVDTLKNRGFHYDCFEAHCPYLLDKELYPKTLFGYNYGFDSGFCGNTLYYNSNGIKGRHKTKFDLIRIEKEIDYVSLCNESKDSRFLNFTNTGLCEGVKQFLQKRFPTKSIYEI